MPAPADQTVPWRALLAETRDRLSDLGSPSPDLDARRMVEEASGFTSAELLVGLDTPATVRGVAHLDAMVARRAGGEPLQYVLGSWGFRTLDLMVDRRVLIPRPETEGVVEVALAELDRLRLASPDRPMVVVDLGTGSGAVALSVAAERPRVEVWATDISAPALDVARANLAALGRRGTAVRIEEGSWFEALPPELAGSVDLIVSNPPYVASSDPLPSEVEDFEPRGALVSGPDGTEDLHHLLEVAPRWLRRPGALVVELAPHQAGELVARAGVTGFDQAQIHPDLSGRPRALVARLDVSS
jgi:release factor glutamine methyltransferase